MTDHRAPLVSVIVPNYRHAAFLSERLGSIAGQTMRDLEIILLDDASGDGSEGILRAFAANEPRVVHLEVNERNSGSPFKQWRKGLSMAKGRWVWIAESDDRCAPELLERLLEFNTRNEGELGLVFSQSEMVDENGASLGSWVRHTASLEPDPFREDFVMEGGTFASRLLSVRNVVPNASAVLFKRELVQGDALWSEVEDMRMCGDWLFWVRLSATTTVGFVADQLNHFRTHGAMSRAHNSLEKMRTRLLEESKVRSALAKLEGVDQQREELELYRNWARLWPVRGFNGSAFDAIRLPGRARPDFLAYVMRARLKDRLGSWFP